MTQTEQATPGRRQHRGSEEDGSPENEMVLTYVALARSLAAKYRDRGESRIDLDQVALVGLVKAAKRFDPQRGVTFSTYATSTILGELKRHFRDTRWQLHVSRRAQENYLAVRDTIDECTPQLGRTPTLQEVASRVNLPEAQVAEALRTANALHIDSLESISHSANGPGVDPWSVESRADGVDHLVDALTVTHIVGRLPERDQVIVRMRFAEGLTQSNIAARLGMSQMQVSRALSRVLAGLRREMIDRE